MEILEANDAERALPVIGMFLGIQSSGNVAYQCNRCLIKKEIARDLILPLKMEIVDEFINNHICNPINI